MSLSADDSFLISETMKGLWNKLRTFDSFHSKGLIDSLRKGNVMVSEGKNG